MKRAFFVLGTFLILFYFSSTAGATPITFDVADAPDSSVGLIDVNTGYTIPIINWTIGENTSLTASLVNGLDDVVFTLDDNQSKSFNFIEFAVVGTGIGDFDIETTLAFDEPDGLSGDFNGDGGWGTISWDIWLFKGSVSGGILSWVESYKDIILSDGNIVRLALEDGIAISCDGTTKLEATVTNLGGAAPVPEPATMLLLGTGLVGLAAGSRKKIFKKK